MGEGVCITPESEELEESEELLRSSWGVGGEPIDDDVQLEVREPREEEKEGRRKDWRADSTLSFKREIRRPEEFLPSMVSSVVTVQTRAREGMQPVWGARYARHAKAREEGLSRVVQQTGGWECIDCRRCWSGRGLE
jgi:hypothetical protein